MADVPATPTQIITDMSLKELIYVCKELLEQITWGEYPCVHNYQFGKPSLYDLTHSKPNSLLLITWVFCILTALYRVPNIFWNVFYSIWLCLFFLNVLHQFPIHHIAPAQLFTTNGGVKTAVGSTCWIEVALGLWLSKTCTRPWECYQIGMKAFTSCLPLLKSYISVSTHNWKYGGCHLLPSGNHLYNQKEHLPLLLVHLPECWHPPYNSRGKSRERERERKKSHSQTALQFEVMTSESEIC